MMMIDQNNDKLKNVFEWIMGAMVFLVIGTIFLLINTFNISSNPMIDKTLKNQFIATCGIGFFFTFYLAAILGNLLKLPECIQRLYYILCMMILMAIGLLAFTIDTNIPFQENTIFIKAILRCFMFLMFMGILLVTDGRLQDMNCNGNLSFLLLIPIVNFMMILALMCIPGTHGDNQYGEDPRLKGIRKPLDNNQD